jgi:hypothetical protein
MPLYVRVTIDGDNADFAHSRRILLGEWSQPKQKCIGKTPEAPSRIWMDDPVVEKTLVDAQYTFLLKFLYKVLKETTSHETFRKWVNTKNTFALPHIFS